MDFKKLFSNDKAVSPVIGVILMVAITVILAAAIGSSVFGEGTAESAPQANFDIKAAGFTTISGSPAANVKIEHLGGDTIHFGDATVTKAMATVGTGDAVPFEATTLGTFDVGSVKTIVLRAPPAAGGAVGSGALINVPAGSTVNIKFIDAQTNQLICDKDIRF